MSGPGAERAPHRAAFSIGWQIMAASAALVVGIIVIAIVWLTHQARPSEKLEHTTASSPHAYIDLIDTVQGLLVIGAGAVVFAGVVSLFVARRAVRPLGEALRLQRQFVADASHELRTPLAVLDARLQVVERRLCSGTAVDQTALTELRADSRALVEIVDDLLLAAGGDHSRAEPIDALAVAGEAVDSLRILAASRQVTVAPVAVAEGPQELAIPLPATSFRRCVVALVDNAVAHSPAGSTVRTQLERSGRTVVLTVADEGSGITGIAPARVFDRFAHSEAAADPETATPAAAPGPAAAAPTRPSFGIGLALVRDIATRSGGSVEVASTSSAGTVFRLVLPAAG